MSGTVVILGAGATKSVGGPLTNDILYDAFQVKGTIDPTNALDDLQTFLREAFHVTDTSPASEYPGLPFLMSLLDTALDRKQTLYGSWNVDAIRKVRQSVEFAIYALLENRLVSVMTSNHYELLGALFVAPQVPTIISLNYDLVIDTAMMYYSETIPPNDGRFPDYGCDIRTEFYRSNPERFGMLLKLHGSLNWLYCETCQRLEVCSSSSRPYIKILSRLLASGNNPSMEDFYLSAGSPCPVCGTLFRPLLITPTHRKDYRNPHIAQVWYQAERVLREADRAIFIGYSLPDDDVEVAYLMKRGLAHLPADKVTVVEYVDPKDCTLFPQCKYNSTLKGHPVGRRYHALFGDIGANWHTGGLDDWLNSIQGAASLAG